MSAAVKPAGTAARKVSRPAVVGPAAKAKPTARATTAVPVLARSVRAATVAKPVVREVPRRVAALPTSRAAKPVAVRPSKRGLTPKVPLARGLVRGKALARTAPVATRLVRVKALDPCARCGPNTSVEQLYRVDEQVAGTATVHLVFFDRHGWYCVHGASCVAVRDVHAELKAQRAGAGRRR